MKLNIAYPANGTEKHVEVSLKDEQRFYGKMVGDQFDGAIIGPDFNGTVLEIRGGNDHQGFCMVKGKDTTKRLRLLLKKGDTGFKCRRRGVRMRKTVRGSKVSGDIQCLNVVLLKENENLKIEDLTDVIKPKGALPKKLSTLKKLFGCDDDKNIIEHIKSLDIEKMPKLKIVKNVRAIRAQKRYENMQARRERHETNEKLLEEYNKKYNI